MAKKEKPIPLRCHCGRWAVVAKIRPNKWACGCVGCFRIVYEENEIMAIEHWNEEEQKHEPVRKRH